MDSSLVGWDDGADRASNDADVSIVLPKIPYGGFSPVRLQGRLIGRGLPAWRLDRVTWFASVVRIVCSLKYSSLCVEVLGSAQHRRASDLTALPQGPSL